MLKILTPLSVVLVILHFVVYVAGAGEQVSDDIASEAGDDYYQLSVFAAFEL